MTCSFESLRALAWAALIALAIHPAAHAEMQSGKMRLVATVRVSYADLNLTRREDAEILLGRIEKAAFRACGGKPQQHMNYNVIPARVTAAFKECREDAIVRAISAIHTPTLSQAYVATRAM